MLLESLDAYMAIYDMQDFPPRHDMPARAQYVPASDLAIRRLRVPSLYNGTVLVVYHRDDRSVCDKLLARLHKDKDRDVHVASMENELLRKWPLMRKKRMPPTPAVCRTPEDWTKMPLDVVHTHNEARAPSCVLPFVFVGDCDDVRAEEWNFQRVVHICTSERRFDCLCKTSMRDIVDDPERHLRLHVNDAVDEDITRYFEGTNAFIARAVQLREPVIVHCFAGRSRSPAIVLAYMMSVGMSFDEAYKLMASVRPIDINLGFVAQLREYERKLGTSRTT